MSARRPASIRGVAAALLSLSLGLATAASGQEAEPEIADVPSGPATLRGRVVHAERPEAAGGVAIVLYALDASGTPGTRRAETAADGSFTFEGLSNEPDVVYLVGARYAELPFPGDRVVFAPGETERTIEVPIFEPSDDLAKVKVEQSSLRVALGGPGRLVVAEVHRLRNEGERVFYVPGERRAGRRAPLEAELLPGVTDFAMPLGVVPEGAVRDGRDFTFWGPLYPGTQEISFRYDVPVETGAQTLAKRFPSAAERIRVFGAEGGPLEAVPGLESAAVVEEDGRRFQPYEVVAPGAGFVARLALDVPEMRADPGAVRLAEGQIVLEVDDVTLQASEMLRLEVDGDVSLRADPGELLVSLPLPSGAEGIRFSADASALGLVRTDDGVGLVGPLEPGAHGIGLAYSLRSGPDGVDLARRFDRRVPLLRVFVADTGVAVSSGRLHRRRPVRDADRTYLIFEAFELEADERADLTLAPLPPRAGRAGPGLAAALVVGLVSLVFLATPLRGGASEASDDEDEAVPATRNEREHVYESIRDLDHDYETGKIDEEGYQTLRAELRARAVALLAEEKRGGDAGADADAAVASDSAGAAPASDAAPCGNCGAAPRPGDRFCAGCGAALGDDPA